MKKSSKGILIAIMSLSLLFCAVITAYADINDPFVYVNTTSANTTSASTTVVNPYASYKDAVIYADDYSIYVGDEFDIMNDVEAYDDDGYGEDITDQVTVSGYINTAEPGDYYITYEVTGANGNTVDYEICVTVIDPEEEEEIEVVIPVRGARQCTPEELYGSSSG